MLMTQLKVKIPSIKIILYLLTGLSIVAFTSPSLAKQLSFNKTLLGEEYLFEYEWLDKSRTLQTLSFKLPVSTVNNQFRHFKALRFDLMRMHAIKKLKSKVAQIDPKLGRVIIKPQKNGVEFAYRSYDQQWILNQEQEMNALYENALKEYIQQEYYTEFEGFETIKNKTIYKPDHQRFILESIPLLTPVAEAISQSVTNTSVHIVAEFVLSWIQTIPYSSIDSRSETNGAGYLPPNRLLANNIGDCDSKVSLMAAIMKSFYPKLEVAIVFVPNHALLALHLAHVELDYRIRVGDYEYTLTEPVGPALIEFTKVSEQSKRFIESGYYVVEPISNN